VLPPSFSSDLDGREAGSGRQLPLPILLVEGMFPSNASLRPRPDAEADGRRGEWRYRQPTDAERPSWRIAGPVWDRARPQTGS
jgi:hypothetical protein